MQTYAAFAIYLQLDSLLEDAARRRAQHTPTPSLRARLASRLAGLNALLEGAAVTAPIRTPRTQGYPYEV
jgi:hypothetical protein